MHVSAFDYSSETPRGLPVSTPVAAAGRVRTGHLPATTVARAILHGNYAGLSAAWGELDAWIAAHGYAPGPELWERYVVGPESSSNPADWRTELNRPVTR
jgi:effector-binding domain-containing protein